MSARHRDPGMKAATTGASVIGVRLHPPCAPQAFAHPGLWRALRDEVGLALDPWEQEHGPGNEAGRRPRSSARLRSAEESWRRGAHARAWERHLHNRTWHDQHSARPRTESTSTPEVRAGLQGVVCAEPGKRAGLRPA